LKDASVGVTVGEKVRTGQVIGRVGNSGNSSAPHLHFQLQSGPLPLSSNEVPWEINAFTLVGTVTVDGLIDQPKPGPRRHELPLGESVSTFRS
jgi:murein DD-endopeptidase MepM/ murein hydrolase activator NlpD